MTQASTKNTLLIAFVTLLYMACREQAQPVSDPASFLTTLDIHLNAIKTSNLKELEPTIADNVIMIGPDGTKFETKEVFIDFHKKWFARTNWEWKGNILKTEVSDSLGYAFINYHFIQKDTVGDILFEDKEYLALIFKNSVAGWQLVHDQNTRIQ